MQDWVEVLKQIQYDMLSDIAKDIKSVLDLRNINASGNLKDSIRVELDGDRFVLTSADYLESALEGTKPNSNNITQLQRDIFKWLGDKGLPQNNSLAYLIARKINTEGSSKYRNPAERISLSDVVNGAIDYNEIQNDLSQAINNNL